MQLQIKQLKINFEKNLERDIKKHINNERLIANRPFDIPENRKCGGC